MARRRGLDMIGRYTVDGKQVACFLSYVLNQSSPTEPPLNVAQGRSYTSLEKTLSYKGSSHRSISPTFTSQGQFLSLDVC